MASRAVSFGGSRKPMKPASTRSCSSATQKTSCDAGTVLCATATTRNPSSLSVAHDARWPGRAARRESGSTDSPTSTLRADAEDLLDRALADQDALARRVADDDRHPAADEIERDFVDLLGVLQHVQFVLQFDVFQHGAVEQVLQPGLVVAVQVGVLAARAELTSPRMSRCFSSMTRSCVSVPVLSVQRTSIAPRF